MEKPELFLISWDVIDACGIEEIVATYDDMQALGIARMPYRLVDIGLVVNVTQEEIERVQSGQVDMLTFQRGKGDPYDCEIKFRYRDECCYQILVRPHRGYGDWIDFTPLGTCDCPACKRPNMPPSAGAKDAQNYKMILIVLLATKNACKTRTKDKLAALGIGKAAKRDNTRPIYTTTITLPPEFTTTTGQSIPHAAGVTLRPHLRRGHKRDQRHGPKLQFVRPIWIEPCFVNADETYVSARTNYNTSMKGTNYVCEPTTT